MITCLARGMRYIDHVGKADRFGRQLLMEQAVMPVL
jgi:hypothetical protein